VGKEEKDRLYYLKVPKAKALTLSSKKNRKDRRKIVPQKGRRGSFPSISKGGGLSKKSKDQPKRGRRLKIRKASFLGKLSCRKKRYQQQHLGGENVIKGKNWKKRETSYFLRGVKRGVGFSAREGI